MKSKTKNSNRRAIPAPVSEPALAPFPKQCPACSATQLIRTGQIIFQLQEYLTGHAIVEVVNQGTNRYIGTWTYTCEVCQHTWMVETGSQVARPSEHPFAGLPVDAATSLFNVAQILLGYTQVKRQYTGRGHPPTYAARVDAIADTARQLAELVLEHLPLREFSPVATRQSKTKGKVK